MRREPAYFRIVSVGNDAYRRHFETREEATAVLKLLERSDCEIVAYNATGKAIRDE